MKRIQKLSHVLCFVLTAAILGPAFLLSAASVRTESNVVPLVNCDKAFGNFKVDKSEALEGSGCVSYTFSAGTNSFANSVGFAATDCTDTDALVLELYVSNPNMLNYMTQLYLEVTSAGIHDKEETAWPMQTQVTGLQEGWNTVYLYVQNGVATGEINWSKVNYMRIFAFYDGEALDGEVMKIDNIRMAYVGGVDYSDLSLAHNHSDNPSAELIVKGLETAPSVADRDKNITVSCGKKK